MLSCLLINVDSLLNENPRNPLIPISYADLSAEREGFEPPVPLGTVVFKTTVIDHSTISPVLYYLESGCKGTDYFGNEQIFRQLFKKYLENRS